MNQRITQNNAPAFTVATLGVPSKNQVMIKLESGAWMHLTGSLAGLMVDPDDIRMFGWDYYRPSTPSSPIVSNPDKVRLECLDRAREQVLSKGGYKATLHEQDQIVALAEKYIKVVLG